MKAKAIRLPQNLLDAVSFAEKQEKIDEPTAMRKLLRLGIEKYATDLYARGDITLREGSEILGVPLREAMEVFLNAGVSGNVTATQTLKSLQALKVK